jgi:hypothetical protein
MTNTITIKQIKGSLPLYLSLVPLFNLLTKLAASSSSSETSLLLLCSFYFCFPICFDLLNALKAASFISRFSCSVLISYAVKIPCILSMLIEFRPSLSSSADILGSNLIGRDLSTF